MRASTPVAILSLAAGVALSVALPLPAIKSGGAGVDLNKPRTLSPYLHPPSLPPSTPPLLPHDTSGMRPPRQPWNSEPPSFQPLHPSLTQSTPPNAHPPPPPNTPDLPTPILPAPGLPLTPYSPAVRPKPDPPRGRQGRPARPDLSSGPSRGRQGRPDSPDLSSGPPRGRQGRPDSPDLSPGPSRGRQRRPDSPDLSSGPPRGRQRRPDSPDHRQRRPNTVISQPIPPPTFLLTHSTSPSLLPHLPSPSPHSPLPLPHSPLPFTHPSTNSPSTRPPPSPALSSVGSDIGGLENLSVQRDLLEHVDRRIKLLAARAYVRELLKASMDDLD